MKLPTMSDYQLSGRIAESSTGQLVIEHGQGSAPVVIRGHQAKVRRCLGYWVTGDVSIARGGVPVVRAESLWLVDDGVNVVDKWLVPR